jgi:putative PEP-CTERM system TPR-repeat lipoprotein
LPCMNWFDRPSHAVWVLPLCLLLAGGCSKDPEYAKQQYLESGNRFFEQGKYKEAIVQYRNALQQDQRFGEARLKLAQAYTHVGDRRASLREWVRAADALPDDAGVQVSAGGFLLAAGQFEDARARAERALQIDPGHVDAHILLGNTLAGLKDFEGAVKQLEEAVELDPGSAHALTALGAAQFGGGSRPDAEASFRKAVEIAPDRPGAHMALASFLLQSGRAGEAEASFKRALDLDAKNPLAHQALAVFYVVNRRAALAEPHMKALADLDTSPGARRRLALADYYVGMNRIDDANQVLESLAQGGTFGAARMRQAAIEYASLGSERGNRAIDEVLAKEPNNVPALLLKARFLEQEGKHADALARAREAAGADPRSIQAHFMVGSLLRRVNDREGAIVAFTEVIRLNPRAVAAQVQLAQLNLAKGDRRAALQFAQDASTALPDDPGVRVTLARSLIASGDVAGADKEVAALLKAHPDRADVQVLAGSLRLARRDYVAARAAFTRAQEIEANSFEAMSGLLAVDFALKKPDDARARIDKQLARTPDDSRMLMLGGQVYMGLGDSIKSEEMLRASVERDPANLHAYTVLGRFYAARKRLPEARAAFESILEKQPDSVPAHTMVAMILDNEGRRDEARARYERIVQIDPTAAVAANNLAYIYATDGGNLDVALQLAQAAKQRLPEAPEVADTVGLVYLKKDLPGMALPQFEEALRRDPKNAGYQLHLALTQIKLGEKIKARETLEQIVRATPDAREAAEAKKLLASL